MTTKPPKTKPIPTRFDPPEKDFLSEVSSQTGLPQSELIRRGVRALRHTAEQAKGFGFILEIAP